MKRPERINDPTLAWLQAFSGSQAGIWTALPGIVNSVDADMTVSVQPTIQGVVTDTTGAQALVTLPLLIKCPLVFPSAGGFSLTFPVKSGDEVLVIFASRCIDSWWQSGGVQAPAELRMHDISDGFAIPGPRSVPRVLAPAPHSSNVQLRSDDGSAVIEITPGHQINITTTAAVAVQASGNVSVQAGGNASVTASGTMALQSSGDMTLQAPTLNILANVVSTGTFKNNSKHIGSIHYHTAQGSTADTTTAKP